LSRFRRARRLPPWEPAVVALLYVVELVAQSRYSPGVSQTPESLGTGIGPLLADFIPLMPSGARRAGAAQVMAARVGRDPSVLVDNPRVTQLLAMGLGAVGGAYTADQSKPVRAAAMLGPLAIVQLLRHLELRSIQKSYDTEKRKRLRELDDKALLDNPGWFGGSNRLGAVNAYETMRDRKYKGYSSIAEAGDAFHLAASGLHPLLGVSMSGIVSALDNEEAQARRQMHKKAVLGFKALTGHTGPIKAFLRQLRNEGAAVRRVIPETVGARLPNTGAKLPVGTSGYSRGSWDPTQQAFRDTVLDVGKGRPRNTMTMQPDAGAFRFTYGQGTPGGTNPSPIASLLHEGGHHMNHRAMRRAGIGDSMGGHEVPGLPHMDKVMNELGANNSALQFLQQAGARPEAMAYFKGARAPSFSSYVRNLPQTGNPVQQRILAAGPHGFTPGYKGLPDLYKQAEFAEQRNSPVIPLTIAAALLGSLGRSASQNWAVREVSNTPPLGVDKWPGTIASISGTEPLMLASNADGTANAFFYKPNTEKEGLQFMRQFSGLRDVTPRTPTTKGEYGRTMEKLQRLMRSGVMVANERAGAPVIGHEAGHAKIEETPGMLRFLQRHIYPHQGWVAPMAAAGSMAAGLASGSTLKGGLYGTGIGLLSSLGTVGPEAGASYHALRHLKGLGDGSLSAEGKKDLLSALSTYLAGGVLPSVLSGMAGGWISGRRRQKDEEEGVEKSAAYVPVENAFEKAATAWQEMHKAGTVGMLEPVRRPRTVTGKIPMNWNAKPRPTAPGKPPGAEVNLMDSKSTVNPADFKTPYYGDQFPAQLEQAAQYNLKNKLPNTTDGWQRPVTVVTSNPTSNSQYAPFVQQGIHGSAVFMPADAGKFLRDESPEMAAAGAKPADVLAHEVNHAAGDNWAVGEHDDAYFVGPAKDPGYVERQNFMDKLPHDLKPGEHRGYMSTIQAQQFKDTGSRITSPEAYDKWLESMNVHHADPAVFENSIKSVPVDAQRMLRGMRDPAADPAYLKSLKQWQRRVIPGIVQQAAPVQEKFAKQASAKRLQSIAQALENIRNVRKSGVGGAESFAAAFDSTPEVLRRYFFKHPDVMRLGIKSRMPSQKIQDMLKGLVTPPAIPALPPPPPPAAPIQGMLDLFKQGQAHPALPALRAAKEHSDAGDYSMKHKLIRQNMRRHAEDWSIDSDDGKGIVGVTHIPTGFRLHMPKGVVDPDVLRYHNAAQMPHNRNR
jgi:hypothetical protein